MKKAFTLIELIIVIGILAVILWTSYIFRGNNENDKIKYWKECSIYIFQEILNQDNNIKKNKTINSWDKALLMPGVAIKPKGNISWLYMLSENLENNKTLINSDWSCTADHIQNKNEYIIRNKDNDFSINIEKDNNFAAGTIEVCNPWGWNCIEISKIEYNKASNKFDLYFCARYFKSTIPDCQEWEKK